MDGGTASDWRRKAPLRRLLQTAAVFEASARFTSFHPEWGVYRPVEATDAECIGSWDRFYARAGTLHGPDLLILRCYANQERDACA